MSMQSEIPTTYQCLQHKVLKDLDNLQAALNKSEAGRVFYVCNSGMVINFDWMMPLHNVFQALGDLETPSGLIITNLKPGIWHVPVETSVGNIVQSAAWVAEGPLNFDNLPVDVPSYPEGLDKLPWIRHEDCHGHEQMILLSVEAIAALGRRKTSNRFKEASRDDDPPEVTALQVALENFNDMAVELFQKQGIDGSVVPGGFFYDRTDHLYFMEKRIKNDQIVQFRFMTE